MRGGAGANRLECRLGGFDVVQVALAQLDTGAHRVHVRVVEGRHDEPSAQLDYPRLRTGEARDLGAGSEGDDAAITNRDGLDAASSGVQGVDGTAAEDQVRRRRRGHRCCARRSENHQGQQG